MSDTSAIAAQLVALCRQGQNLTAIETLYAPNIVSVEAMDMAGMPRVMEGVEAIKGKNIWWSENHTIHAANVDGPFGHAPDRFAVLFDYDITNKLSGERQQMKEVGLFTVKAGKIVREEFFYGP